MGLLDWHVGNFIGLLPLMLHLSLGLFLLGLVLYLLPQQLYIASVTGIISLATCIVYLVTNMLPIKYSQCPYKTPLSSLVYALVIRILQQVRTVMNTASSAFSPHMKTLNGFELHATEISRAEYDVQALLWLYVRSSTSATRRLVIQALSGLPADCNDAAKRLFGPHWSEIRDEKEDMLRDCMQKVSDVDGSRTRWIPKDDPDIDRSIEQLLRLEIKFPALRRGLQVCGHDLDFRNIDISDTLSITLSSLQATYIHKPAPSRDLRDIAMDALAHNDVHHPVVWKSLFLRAVDDGLFSRKDDTVLNADMCFNLVASLFRPDSVYRASPASSTTTLADIAVECSPDAILNHLLTFFENFDWYQDSMEHRPRLLIAIIRLLVLNSENSGLNSVDVHSSQRPFFHQYSTLSKYRLLVAALVVISREVHDPKVTPSPFWHRGVFEAISAYITSDLFLGASASSQNHSESDHVLKNFEYITLLWTCRAHALLCMASFIERGAEFNVVIPLQEWATRPVFYNILRVMAQSDDYYGHNVPAQPLPHQQFRSLFGIISFLLGRGFSARSFQAYDTFQQEQALQYIAQRSTIHPCVIEGLQGYITLLADAAKQTGNRRGILSSEELQSHINSLHDPSVILAICISIALNGITQRRPILSALASIAPDHCEWNTSLHVTASRIDDDAFLESYYSDSHEVIPPGDAKRLKKNLKDVIKVLTKCLEAEKGGDNGILQVCE